jgi:hypothetical protein
MDEASHLTMPDYVFEYMIWMNPLLNYAYYEYMIWMKPHPLPDYAYFDYMIWMKPHPLTTLILNI